MTQPSNGLLNAPIVALKSKHTQEQENAVIHAARQETSYLKHRGINVKVELVDHTANPVQKIGQYASICYGAKTDRESNIKRAQHCVNSSHLSTLRFSYATLYVQMSRVCLAQFTRSKHLDYLVRSSRYCEESEAEFYAPESIVMAGYGQGYEKHIEESRRFYCNLRDAGVTKQDARFILPQSQMTELYVTGNFQAWRDFIKLRTTKAAQGEIREIANQIKTQLTAIAPEIFGDL